MMILDLDFTLNIYATHTDTALHKYNVRVKPERYGAVKCDFPFPIGNKHMHYQIPRQIASRITRYGHISVCGQIVVKDL